ncbi:uncharacterized protein DUF2793 [Palleronia aestuarii]|uniref:Uncharacterized protein DUF2793 n=1 Tax=Palleronia aestuarii TaxID=568105 RepID=A0A2W7NSX8_9RHOB|nr:DUF2793 domain-containing protein [Palleronia aestuarii]PZX14352.1 uncharacterized protein DUF2793 [Palleronia aestuarii]
MSKSPNLAMPYIQPAQAQKHVTHNLAIELLDALVQLSVSDLAATEPPAAAGDGDVVVVGPGASGVFEGEDGKIAYHTNGGWMFVPPRNGFTAWVEAAGAVYVYQNGAWRVLLAVSEDGSDAREGLGINTGWDATNRLAVSAPATLFTHEGGSHRIKVNKATAADTASLLFQTDFSGRAEMGLAGDGNFSVKVSADGESWRPAMAVEGATGEATFASVRADRMAGDAVQSTPGDTTPGRLMRADWGYGPGNVLGPVSQAGGVPTGAVIERGTNTNGTYTRFADGTQICTQQVNFPSPDRAYGAIFSSGNVDAIWTYPKPFIDIPAVSGIRNYTGGYWLIGPATAPSDFLTTFRGRIASALANTGERSLGLFAIGAWT